MVSKSSIGSLSWRKMHGESDVLFVAVHVVKSSGELDWDGGWLGMFTLRKFGGGNRVDESLGCSPPTGRYWPDQAPADMSPSPLNAVQLNLRPPLLAAHSGLLRPLDDPAAEASGQPTAAL